MSEKKYETKFHYDKNMFHFVKPNDDWLQLDEVADLLNAQADERDRYKQALESINNDNYMEHDGVPCGVCCAKMAKADKALKGE